MKKRVFVMFERPARHHGLIGRFYGKPQFNHVEIYFVDRDASFIAVQDMVSAIIKNISRFGQYAPHPNKAYEWTAVELDTLSNEEIDSMYDFCNDNLVGRPYNLGGLLACALPGIHLKVPTDSLFCSEAVAMALESTQRVKISDYNISSFDKVKPSDVFHMCLSLSEPCIAVLSGFKPSMHDAIEPLTDEIVGLRNETGAISVAMRQSNKILESIKIDPTMYISNE